MEKYTIFSEERIERKFGKYPSNPVNLNVWLQKEKPKRGYLTSSHQVRANDGDEFVLRVSVALGICISG